MVKFIIDKPYFVTMDKNENIFENQGFFRYRLEDQIISIFDNFSSKLNPKIEFIGFYCGDNKLLKNISIEPIDGVMRSNDFQNLLLEIKQIFDKRNSHCNSKNGVSFLENLRYNKPKKDHELNQIRIKIENLINSLYKDTGKTYFVSPASFIQNHYVFITLQIDKKELMGFYHLKKYKRNHFDLDEELIDIYPSFLESLVSVILDKAADSLQTPNSELFVPIDYSDEEILIKSAKKFIQTLVSAVAHFHGAYLLYDLCNRISLQKYESTSSFGKLIICKENHPNIKFILKFDSKYSLSYFPGITRKLLQLSSGNMYLYSDGYSIAGIVELIGDYRSENEDLLIITFKGNNKWELSHDSSTLLVVENKLPKLIEETIDFFSFKELLINIFINEESLDVNKLHFYAETAIRQKKGSCFIIMDKANLESERLKDQSIKISPITLDNNLIDSFTSIDGAILADTKGVCYSIGVILDGDITPNGDTARGARYNSAIRYVDKIGQNCMAIIISEDGMVNFYPSKRHKIKRSEIDKQLILLQEEYDSDNPRYYKFEELIAWFHTYEFYLLETDCKIIKELERKLEKKLNVDYPDDYPLYKLDLWKPHPEMNESYYEPE